MSFIFELLGDFKSFWEQKVFGVPKIQKRLRKLRAWGHEPYIGVIYISLDVSIFLSVKYEKVVGMDGYICESTDYMSNFLLGINRGLGTSL